MVTNMNDFQDVNETFKNFFTADTYPARSFFQVVKLPKNALVMIDAVAVVAGQ
jgi:enamine deaminase RidA (YjgF/YER057c/UK114 family)